jgi:hypothetical protein
MLLDLTSDWNFLCYFSLISHPESWEIDTALLKPNVIDGTAVWTRRSVRIYLLKVRVTPGYGCRKGHVEALHFK